MGTGQQPVRDEREGRDGSSSGRERRQWAASEVGETDDAPSIGQRVVGITPKAGSSCESNAESVIYAFQSRCVGRFLSRGGVAQGSLCAAGWSQGMGDWVCGVGFRVC